jgi:hypothetical protein
LSSYFKEIKTRVPVCKGDRIINAGEGFFIDFITQKVGDDELRIES